jgi:hypothetical protein
MASSLPPVKGVAFSFETALVSVADTDIFKAGPTLASGDCKVIRDGTYDDNIDSLPSAVGSCTNVITVALSATEMDADRVTVVLHDAAGDEWQDQVITIFTAAQTLNTTDGIADDIKTAVGVAGAGLTAIPWNAAYDAEIESEVNDALSTMLADSIPADGTRPTPLQALYMIVQYLMERGIVGTTQTIYKADGTTPLLTQTLSDATNPVTITRTT